MHNMETPTLSVLLRLISLAAVVLFFVGVFKMKDDLEGYYNTTEPINLRLSGVMTFFLVFLLFPASLVPHSATGRGQAFNCSRND